ncbi:TIGR04282 family arsenosugar biosynthesis glycosyltransferase [Hahella ganghwensis]|uniref:TIGR04282 family arsenosugar biosynthesis glycosyltransferase n=1 Tax=Hahella ganghwensis TaxID=286420 RepID=UPI000370313E|nr:TIGR04282 family arsenosugar biosynthesis glycosyltransferase [Hahella ganghwensis]
MDAYDAYKNEGREMTMIDKDASKGENIALIQFAKRPVSGLVKTRLIPELGEAEATRVHETLLKKTLETLVDSGLGEVQLWWDKAWDDEAYLHQLDMTGKIKVFAQHGKDLGERMYHALSSQLEQFEKVILVGSDCPVLSPDYLCLATDRLDSADMVLGPSDDGGYVLIGTTEIAPGCLENVQWGTESVLEATVANINSSGLKVALLNALWDVDVGDDYRRWKSQA